MWNDKVRWRARIFNLMEKVTSSTNIRPDYRLTAREQEVLALAAQGLSRTQIGEQLGLRLYTISSHLKNIHRKLGVHSRAAAVAVALRQGLLADPSQRLLPVSKAGLWPGAFLTPLSFNVCPRCGCNFAEGARAAGASR
jgi:DNA-binding CsgD family transcriptional regulator